METLEKPIFFIDEEHVEIVNGIYSYNFTLDLTKEITDAKTAASLLTFEQNNPQAMHELFTEDIKLTTVDDLIAIANKLRLLLLEHENIDNLS